MKPEYHFSVFFPFFYLGGERTLLGLRAWYSKGRRRWKYLRLHSRQWSVETVCTNITEAFTCYKWQASKVPYHGSDSFARFERTRPIVTAAWNEPISIREFSAVANSLIRMHSTRLEGHRKETSWRCEANCAGPPPLIQEVYYGLPKYSYFR